MTTYDKNPKQSAHEPPEYHIHNTVALGGAKGWNVLTTFLVVGGIVVIGYQLSLGPWAEITATAISMFIVTLVSMAFKAGILRLPEIAPEEDDLAFTKSTLRRIYDEIQAAIVKSSVLRLVFFAAMYTAGFLVLRAVVAFGLGALNSMWMAIGVGLIAGAAVIAQDQIWAWIRRMHVKKGRK